MEKITRYIGKVVDKHIFLICRNREGNMIQVPHVELFTDELVAMTAPEGTEPKEPYKFLTRREVARFFHGMDIEGNVLETPSECCARINKIH